MKFKALFGAGVAAAALFTVSTAQAGEWKTMPLFDDDWSPEFTLAYGGGILNGDDVDGDFAHSAQFSLNCPWFTPPTGAIRQQFNYNVSNDGNTDIQSLEMNPRYYFGTDDLRFGIGPGVGHVWAENGANTRNAWSVQAGADLEYRSGKFFTGAAVRYQLAQKGGTANTGVNDLDNLLTTVRVGVNF